MCGIAGFTAPGPDAERVIARMNRALAHRGPDGRGNYVDAEIALGHTRLAVIDLAGGVQPRVDRASGDALTFNGEIYGYRELATELRISVLALAVAVLAYLIVDTRRKARPARLLRNPAEAERS